MDSLISVIIPVYNAQSYLERCADSVIAQTYSNLEILLVDDGSTDCSPQICDRLAIADSRIRVIHKQNAGVSSARNAGLGAAVGDYITFVDSDDYLHRDYVETLYRAMLTYSNAGCAICGCFTTSSSCEKTDTALTEIKMKNVAQPEIIGDFFYMRKPFVGAELTAVWGTLYRADLLKDVRFDLAITIGEDLDFKYSVLLRTDSVVYVNSALYFYYVRSDSAMRSGFDVHKLQSLRNLEKIIDRSENPEYRAGAMCRFVNVGFVIMLMIPVRNEYSDYRENIATYIKKYRTEVLKNPLTRKKVRFALILSYLGMDMVQYIFAFVAKLH